MKGNANTGGPRAFQFSKLNDGNVGLLNRDFAGDESLPWIGLDGKAGVFIPVFFPSTPPPSLSLSMCTADVRLPSKLESTIGTIREFLALSEHAVETKLEHARVGLVFEGARKQNTRLVYH